MNIEGDRSVIAKEDFSQRIPLHERFVQKSSIREDFQFNASAVLYRIGGIVAPRLTGLIATRRFGKSRLRPHIDNELLPIGATQFVVCDDEVKKGYLWKACGPTVLLMHGWSSDSSSMFGFVKPLLKVGFNVVSFDAPGHGASHGSRTTMSRIVEAGMRVIQAVGQVDFMVGHSLGAVSCAALARQVQAEGGRVQAMSFLSAPPSLNAVLENWASARSQQLTSALRAKVRSQLKRDNGVPVAHWNIADLCAGSSVPIFLVHDECDPIVPIAEGVRLKSYIGHVQFMRTSGYGHNRILLAPDVKEEIVQFFVKNDFTGDGHL